MDNYFKMQIPAISQNEAFARNAVSAFALTLSPTIEEINDVKTAVSEAVTNAIVHGYRRKRGEVYITVRMLLGQIFSVEIRDRGCGIPNVEEAMQPLFTTDSEGERSGMGFSVMQTFMDEVSVTSEVGVGTRVLMQKRITGEHEGR